MKLVVSFFTIAFSLQLNAHQFEPILYLEGQGTDIQQTPHAITLFDETGAARIQVIATNVIADYDKNSKMILLKDQDGNPVYEYSIRTLKNGHIQTIIDMPKKSYLEVMDSSSKKCDYKFKLRYDNETEKYDWSFDFNNCNSNKEPSTFPLPL